MLVKRTISKAPPDADPAEDQQHLYDLGMQHVRNYAGGVWTDHNVHDPGITTLELVSYALTDLAYRANMPVEDLLASLPDGRTAAPLPTPRQILPSRALTLNDYRKLLVDLVGVKNAWILPVEQKLWADPADGKLYHTKPNQAGVREVEVRGLYRVLVELNDVEEEEDDDDRRTRVLRGAIERLERERNLCEDFIDIAAVDPQDFLLCAEIELAPEADVDQVQGEILFQVQQYLAPPVMRYTLDEMLARVHDDGSPFTVEEIFDGPALDFGFIDDDELVRAELRTEVRLSDVISVIMDIEHVDAVRDILINPAQAADANQPLASRWVVPVEHGKQPRLDRDRSRLVTYKRRTPIPADPTRREAHYHKRANEVRDRLEKDLAGERKDLEAPRGRRHDVSAYRSFQYHFPALYGLGEAGLPSGATAERQALAYQLKAYLAFFDQIMADHCAQLAHVADLFSTDKALKSGNVEHPTYFHQNFELPGAARIYNTADPAKTISETLDQPATHVERRNRFLDHLAARFGESFHDYAIATAKLHQPAKDLIAAKCALLECYRAGGTTPDLPEISAGRGLGYDQTQPSWNTANVSGVEQRLALLLGMPAARRQDLGVPAPGVEGMLLIENILLRTTGFGDPLFTICGDSECSDCAGDDPYSYRVHVVLPARSGRFTDMDFRRFVEEVIRREVPAHVLPKVCWVDRDDMQRVEQAYRAWLDARTAGAADVAAKLGALQQALQQAKNVYPSERLRPCKRRQGAEEQRLFLLGRTALGSIDEDNDR